VTPTTPVASGPTDAGPLEGGVFDAQGQQASIIAAGEADAAAAMSAGMSAEGDRRNHYETDIMPAGAAYGDAMDLPVVPPAAVPPAMSDLFPYNGAEPTPADAGFSGVYGGS
jgi:hypothetical protein